MRSAKEALKHYPRLRAYLRSIRNLLRGGSRLSYAPISKELIYRTVDKPDPTILDIGCNDGRHTLWFLQMFKKPRVFCFEPDPRAISRFKKTVGDPQNVRLFEIALSDQNGETTFYQSRGAADSSVSLPETWGMEEGWDASGSIRKPKRHLIDYPQITFDESVTVQTMTLDTWCDENGIEAIDFIWMDVQGAEMDVIRGGEKVLARTRYIYTEYSDKELYEGQSTLDQLLNALPAFKILKRYPGDVLLENVALPHSNSKGVT
jgi:FkbM family methyltransferase